MSAAALQTVNLVTQELQTQTLNSIVGGFSFAAAMSWMDFVRWTITQIVKVPKNGGAQYAHDRGPYFPPLCGCLLSHLQ